MFMHNFKVNVPHVLPGSFDEVRAFTKFARGYRPVACRLIPP